MTGTTVAQDQVRAARSPRDAIMALAAHIDVLLDRLAELEAVDNWDDWSTDEEHHREAVQVLQTEDATTIHVAAVSEEKMQARREFAETRLGLEAEYPLVENPNEIYAKVGPAWLYEGDGDKYVMELPRSTRQAMVADVAEDDPKYAARIASVWMRPDEVEPNAEGDHALAVGKVG